MSFQCLLQLLLRVNEQNLSDLATFGSSGILDTLRLPRAEAAR